MSSLKYNKTPEELGFKTRTWQNAVDISEPIRDTWIAELRERFENSITEFEFVSCGNRVVMLWRTDDNRIEFFDCIKVRTGREPSETENNDV